MADLKMGAVETRFAELIWDNEPMGSGELVKLCAKELNWKKSTTYTVLKKLCDRGIFANEDGVVRSLYNKEQFYAAQSRQYVEETFQGSLPAFMAAFSAGHKLSEKELKEVQALLDSWKGTPA
jgi:predicted transcriptional regulator